MKNCKRKGLLGILSVVVIILIIFAGYKIREYNILKDVFLFSKDNVVSIWKLEKGQDTYDYNYKLWINEIDFLSDILSSSKLKKATINDSPSSALGSMTILLDGKQIEENGDINFQFKRSITLTPIDNHSVYVFLEINKPIDDGSFNMKTVMQKSYIINSEKLVAFMSGRS